MKARMSDADKQAVVEQAKALAERQAQEDDPSILPKVGLEDIPAEMHIASGEQEDVAGVPVAFYPQPTACRNWVVAGAITWRRRFCRAVSPVASARAAACAVRWPTSSV